MLREVKSSGAEDIVFLGDIVGYGASPAECVKWVRKLSGQMVIGNHDAALRVFRKSGYEPPQTNWRRDDYAGEPCAITVGSVGQPREEDNRKASWALWDPEHRMVEFRRTEYDRLKAARDIVNAGLPLDAALRLLEPEEMKLFLRECVS